MSRIETTGVSDEAEHKGGPGGVRLPSKSLGVPGILFLIIACTAPLTTAASNITLSIGFGPGAGTLGWFVAVGLLLATFTVGYVVLSRHVVNTGAYFAYVGFGLGREAGAAAAFLAALIYNLATTAMVAAAGFFLQLAASTYASVDISWAWWAALVFLIVAALGYYGIDVAAKLTAVVSLLQFVLLFLLAAAVLVQSPERFNLDGFTPTAMTSGNYALGIVFVVLCFASYETAAVYAEEAKASLAVVKRATYGALALLGVIFMIATWSLLAAFDDPVGQAAADPGGTILVAAEEYLGSWASVAIVCSIAAAFVAAAIAFHNMAARYMFALGRAGLVHQALGRVHHRQGSPHVASFAQDVVTLLVLIPFVVLGRDPLIDLFPAVAGINSLGMVAMMLACSISVVVAYSRKKVEASALSGWVFPVVSAVGFAAVLVLIVRNYPAVVGSDAGYVTYVPLVPVAAAIIGVVAQRRRKGATLENYLGE